MQAHVLIKFLIRLGQRFWAAGSWRGKVRVWQQGGKLLHLAWQAHTSTVSTLAFSPDGRTLATGSWDGALKLWDIESGDLLWTSWRTNNIQPLAFAPDGRTLASGSFDRTLKLWDVESRRACETLTGHTDKVRAIAWSPDGRILASCGFDQTTWLWDVDGAIRLWDLHSGEHLHTLRRDRTYERLTITGIRGLSEAQKSTLCALGAIEDAAVPGTRQAL